MLEGFNSDVIRYCEISKKLTSWTEKAPICKGTVNTALFVDSKQFVKEDAQLSQRDRAAGCVSFGQKWKTRFTDIIGLCSTTVTKSTCKAIEFGEKRKIRAITSFKVIRGRCQSKARIRLLISNSVVSL